MQSFSLLVANLLLKTLFYALKQQVTYKQKEKNTGIRGVQTRANKTSASWRDEQIRAFLAMLPDARNVLQIQANFAASSYICGVFTLFCTPEAKPKFESHR